MALNEDPATVTSPIDPTTITETNIDQKVANPGPPSLRILTREGQVLERPIERDETTIGKAPTNDILLADAAVSHQHAKINLVDGSYILTDLGSRNGTILNDTSLKEPRPLQHGDVIKMGRTTITFHQPNESHTVVLTPSELGQLAIAKDKESSTAITEDALADALVAAKLVAADEMTRVRSASGGRRLYRALVDDNLASEESLRDIMSRTFNLPIADLYAHSLDPRIVSVLPAKLVANGKVLPLESTPGSLKVAIADPTDTELLNEIRGAVPNKTVALELATPRQLTSEIDRHFAPRLVGISDAGEKTETLLRKKELGIGKATHNDLVLSDPTVSNTHAVILSRDGGHSIVDLGSSNGTFVNGEPIGKNARTLKHGDQILLGRALLTFRNPLETTENRTSKLSPAALEEVRRRSASPEGGFAAKAGGGAASAVEDAAKPENGDSAEKKKKKKKKDDRLRAAYVSGLSRILAQIIGVALTVALTIYISRSFSGGEKGVVRPEISSHGKLKPKLEPGGGAGGTPFHGGEYEASGVVFVPGTNGVLFVDDNRKDSVLWMQLDHTGSQFGEIKSVPLGVSVADPESITFDGTYFYVLGSQSHPKYGDENAWARFQFDPTTQSVKGTAEIIKNLRPFILDHVKELRGDGQRTADDGGVNIEGHGFDLTRNRFLLGLRAPLISGNAIVVPITLQNPKAPFTLANLVVANSSIQLPLTGQGIRDISYDPFLKSFLVISGAPEHGEKTPFKLWEWSGSDTSPAPTEDLREEVSLGSGIKPEGITHAVIEGKNFLFVVGDASQYFSLEYQQ
jgi:pSer/pThr/pTyr-binding forkhead associated (FHA) protein